MSRKQTPEINAGSMADIAFLLLIFFLVTTTLTTDAGISRKIPKKPEDNFKIDIKQKNILEVNINFKNELFVEGNNINISDLKQIAIDFIDNAGGLDKENNTCNWCEGRQNPLSSDHPSKAIISIQTDRRSTYETYINTLDILNSAYSHLRNKLAIKLYQQNYISLLENYEKSNFKDKNLGKKVRNIREKYPLLISDAEIKN